ncbi:MAG: trimethylamine methyltransferase family protein [Deltaproteobacteria bacterium]|jgi:trimethylamine--corrinoid protein Co-methyltransferase|nr:trimethylamine methyltransferase family protein [Deltaproteobacteria bacterium]
MLPVYNALTQNEMDSIHEASLKVLAETGVLLSHSKSQDILAQHGAKISDDRQRVFMPQSFVEKMVKLAPTSFPCAAVDPQFDLEMKPGNNYMRMVGGPISLIDLRDNSEKTLTMADNLDAARLINKLPHVNIASCMTPQDINPLTYDVEILKELLTVSRKHIWALTTHSSHLRHELRMVEAVLGSKEAVRKRPIVSGIFCVIDPLRYPDDELERLLLWGDYGIPVRVPITSLVGANSPYTLAGSLTQINAEYLSSTAIIQAICPGLGVWYYPLLQVLDMSTGRSVANGPELMYLYAGAAALAGRYSVPSTYSSGTLTTAAPQDIAFHYGSNLTLASLLNITEQGGAGSVNAAACFSHQALVMIDEFLAYLKTLTGGSVYNEETLAVKDIADSFEKGEFVSSKLTLKHVRQSKRFAPKILDYKGVSPTQDQPDSLVDRAERKVREILASDHPAPLPASVEKDLNSLLEAAKKELL